QNSGQCVGRRFARCVSRKISVRWLKRRHCLPAGARGEGSGVREELSWLTPHPWPLQPEQVSHGVGFGISEYSFRRLLGSTVCSCANRVFLCRVLLPGGLC